MYRRWGVYGTVSIALWIKSTGKMSQETLQKKEEVELKVSFEYEK